VKITGWHVEGFGVFNDFAVRGLNGRLTVFLGPNEAGKSTLVAFIRGALFGFDGRTREPRHAPLRGGRHGGRLFFTPAGLPGDFVVERIVGRRASFHLTRPDGSGASEADLRRVLGGADDRLFRSIFAFSLTELQSFDTLTEEGVRDRIFSAGIDGAGYSAREAIRELDKRMASLLKQRGQATINDLVAELSRLHSKSAEARRAAAGYDDLLAGEQRIAAALDEQDRLIREAMAQRTHVGRLQELWPVYEELEAARAELQASGAGDPVPEEVEESLAALLQDVRILEHAIDELEGAHASLAARRPATGPDDRLQRLSGAVARLFESLSLHRGLLDRAGPARELARRAAAAVDEAVRALGSAAPDERSIATFALSIERRDRIREWSERLAQSAAEVERLRSEVEIVSKRRDQLRDAAERLGSQVGDTPAAAEAVEEQLRALRRLRSATTEVRDAEADASRHAAHALDRRRELERARSGAGRIPTRTTALAALALLGAVSIAAWWIGGARLAAIVAATGAAFSLMTALLAARAAVGARGGATIRQLEEAVGQAVSLHTRHAERAAHLVARVAAEAEALDLPARPAANVVDEAEARLNAAREEALGWRERRARHRDAAANADQAAREARSLSDALGSATRRAALERSRWDEWTREAGLPPALSPRAVLEWCDAVGACRERMRVGDAAVADLDAMERQIDAWQEAAREALRAAGADAPFESDRLIEALLALRTRCVADQRAREALAVIDADATALATKLADARARLDRARARLADFLRSHGAGGEAELRAKLAAARRRAGLAGRAAALDRQIASGVGRGPEADALLAELASGTVERWHADRAALDARLEALREERDEAIGRLRDARRSRADLESSADVAQIELDQQGAATELARAVREWRTAALARSLIEDTLREFERTRQPAVLEEASRMFRDVTSGRYTRLIHREGEPHVIVVDRHEGRRSAEVLSRGTAEQLYLCIRLALAAEFARRSEPLPLVMDDVLVNFDPARARAVARLIAGFSRDHQVLLFTCHPATCNMLLDEAPDAGIVELPSFEPVAPRAPEYRHEEVQASVPDALPEPPEDSAADDEAPEVPVRSKTRAAATPLLDLLDEGGRTRP
jgi:uncharacterized protein YhaN